ncbi:MAG: hypothetical protein LUB83_06175 [Prevotellaceae bacterium]|nr:hypothetical protein [Prevotellaceae bacterium]
MKKAFICLLALLLGAKMYSYPVVEYDKGNSTAKASLKVASQSVTSESIYYGAKASGKANNPCKGPTIRVCGVVKTQLIPIDESQTAVSKQTTDADGKIISTSYYVIDKPIEEAKEIIETQTLSAGGKIVDK